MLVRALLNQGQWKIFLRIKQQLKTIKIVMLFLIFSHMLITFIFCVASKW